MKSYKFKGYVEDIDNNVKVVYWGRIYKEE